MSIRLPLRTVGTFSPAAAEVGAGSVNGVLSHTFTLPQDVDNVVVKFTASLVGGAYSAILQTTDDGGTTYYDVARTSIVTNANTTTAEWLSVPVNGFGYATTVIAPSVVAVGSVVTRGSILSTIGRAGASTVGQRANTGLPILSQQGRIFVVITGDITDAAANTYVATVSVNSQSATA